MYEEPLVRRLAQELLSSSFTSKGVGIFVVCFIAWMFLSPAARKSKCPTINEPQSMWSKYSVKSEYITDAKGLIARGFKKFGGPFTLVTENGPIVMLPPEYIDAINQEDDLSFNAYTDQHHLATYDTFRTFRQPPKGLFEEAVMKGLTRSLPKFTKPLSLEMAGCLDRRWTRSSEWHEVKYKADVLSWVSRLSTRIFVGKRLSEEEEWLRISVDFTINCFIGMAICRLFPAGPLRWLADKLLPPCRKVRRDYRAAEAMLRPLFAERQTEIAAAHREGREPNLPDDSIEWFRNASKGRYYNEVDLQLALAVAAIHTTSDLLAQSMLNLCVHQELVGPLRQEIVSVLTRYGWQKVALTELRLLDSFLKETQRLKPITMATMHRRAVTDVELPNGLKIGKGESTAISSHLMWSAEAYTNPEHFDGYRYFERRKTPGYENRSLLVSTSQDHLGFSHGKHACPGRFFAANEVKIAMVHLLMKYDMKLEDSSTAQCKMYGINMVTNTEARVSVRRRQAEIDLEALEFGL